MVRSYKRKTDRAEINVARLQKAVLEVVKKGRKIRDAALLYGISKTTIHRHVTKMRLKHFQQQSESSSESLSEEENPQSSKYASRQVFSASEESELEQYFLTSAAMNFGLTYANARSLGFQYANALNKTFPPKWSENQQAGKEWMRSFMKRHPKLSYRKPENVSIARTSAFNPANVKLFFENYTAVQEKYKFPPYRVLNLDETGITTVLQAPKVISQSGRRQVGQCVAAERGSLVTFCGIISATGLAIPSVYIYPRVRMKDAFMFGSVPGSVGFASKTGWMNAEIFVKVLEHIKQHMNSSIDNKVLLIVDNHETHVSLAAINYCRENGIVMLSFSPHCTHKMQPLDVGIYGPFKSRCETAFNDYILSNPGKATTIYDIAQLTANPYLLSFTPLNITNAFRKCGIWPINSLVFNDSDFIGVLHQGESLEESSTSNQVDKQIDEATTSFDVDPRSSSKIHIISNEVLVPARNQNDNLKEFVTSLLDSLIDNVLDKVEDFAIKRHKQFLSPKDIRPYPTLKSNRKKSVRKQGRSKIYTSTPEKNEIELQTQKREEKKLKIKSVKRNINGSSKVKMENKNMKEQASSSSLIEYQFTSMEGRTSKIKSKPSKRKLSSSSSDSNASYEVKNHSSDSDIDMTEDYEIEGLLDDMKIDVGDFILVFATKRTIYYYVGCVEDVSDPDEPIVKFLRKKKNCGFFYPVQDDISSVLKRDIVAKIPKPKKVSGSTSRLASYINFDVSFMNYNVL